LSAHLQFYQFHGNIGGSGQALTHMVDDMDLKQEIQIQIQEIHIQIQTTTVEVITCP
jgi:hypothetical protein